MTKLAEKITAIALATIMILGAASCGMDSYVYAFEGSSPFNNVEYSSYNHNNKFSNDLILNGIDISAWQSGTKGNWTQTGASSMKSVDFAVLRVTWTSYGSSGSKSNDSEFETHYKKAKAAGKMIGAYVFSQATNVSEALSEADFAVNRLQSLGIKPADLQLPVYMDYEYSGPSSGSGKGRLYGISKSTATACARAFCERIRAHGYTPGIYANTSFLNNTIDGKSLGNTYDIWVAQYYSNCEYTGTYSKWQYSSSAKISGVYNGEGNKCAVDVNFWYLNTSPYTGSEVRVEGGNEFNYTGAAIMPVFDIYYNNTLLRPGIDYSIAYINNVNRGTGYAYIKPMGVYLGELMIPFTIGDGYVEHRTLANGIIDNYVDQTIDEASSTDAIVDATEPTLVGTDAAGTNYAFDISGGCIRNVPAGLTVENFLAGLRFTNDSTNTMAVINSKGENISGGMAISQGMMLGVFNATGQLIGTADIIIDGSTGIAVCGKGINAVSIQTYSDTTMKLSGTSYYYDGGKKTPKATVYYGASVMANNTSSSNGNVTLSYDKGRTVPGTYRVYATGKSFPGSASATFKIIVKPSGIKSLKRGKKSFTVKTYKQAKKYVTGYQVRYSLSRDMSGAKTKSISSKYNKVSKKITNLKKARTYYVQTRSYKKIGAKKFYSSWSSAKCVTTK